MEDFDFEFDIAEVLEHLEGLNVIEKATVGVPSLFFQYVHTSLLWMMRVVNLTGRSSFRRRFHF